ncbi:ferredoxin [Nocardia carnea]|uniref:Ferredoxin n=1 Tax=Nocardia carnea TaxID=37328 RepID=A0ABW7TLB1_9NOCA
MYRCDTASTSTAHTHCRSPGEGTPRKIIVDRGRCIGSGTCALTAPQLFDQDEERISVVLESEPTGHRVGDARAAERVCPAGAVRISETGRPR